MDKSEPIHVAFFLLFTFLFGVSVLCTAQTNSELEQLFRSEQYSKLFNGMLHKSYPEKVDHLHYFYAGIVGIADSSDAFDRLDRFREIACRSDDYDLRFEMDLLQAYYRVQNGEYSLEEKVEIIQAVADKAMSEEIWHIHLRALRIIANTFWEYQQYELAFETYFSISEILDRINLADFPDMARYLTDIGQAHYFFQDYREAISYFERAVSLPETDFNGVDITRAKNNLGLSYRHLGELDRSDRYYMEILENRESTGWELWEGIATGNLAYNYYLRGNYEEAIPLFEHDIEKAVATNDYGLAAGALIPMADIHLQQNRLDEAGEHLRLAREYVERSGQVDRLRKYYPVMTKWHAARDESGLAAVYVDSTTQAVDAYNEKFNSIKLMRAQQKVDHRLLLAETERALQERNMVIFIIFLFFAGSLAAYIFRNHYLMHKQQIKDLELDNASKNWSMQKPNCRTLHFGSKRTIN